MLSFSCVGQRAAALDTYYRDLITSVLLQIRIGNQIT